jgi:DNA repair photolyase
MPGINDSPRQVDPLVQACAEAGAVSIGGIALHLRGSVKGVFFDWLEEQRPQLLQRYERLYGRRAYAPAEERRRVQKVLQDARKKSPLKPRPRSGPSLRGSRRRKEPAVIDPPALQKSLF